MTLFAVLEFWDYFIIGLMIVILGGGAAAARTAWRPADRDRLWRVENKVDRIQANLGIEDTAPDPAPWQELASDPAKKIAAIKAYREQYGVGLADAKRAVEEYIDGIR